MTPSPTVSVVITTLGRASLLQAVASALLQTLSPEEIVVVDDRPAPDGPPLPLPASDPRVRVVRTYGKGGNYARNRGIDDATGEVIALLDDDDNWFTHKLERQVAALYDAPNPSATLVTCKAYVQSAQTIYPRRPYSQGPLADYLFRRRFPHRSFDAFIQTSSYVFTRELGLRHPFREDRATHQDWDWLLVLEAASVALLTVPEPLYIYAEPSGRAPSSARLAAQQTWALEALPRASYALFGYFFAFAIPRALQEGDFQAAAHALWRAARYGRFHAWTAFLGVGYSAQAVRFLLRQRAIARDPGPPLAQDDSAT
jgi:glycosyltransferase involved in cell wall biosynthesis